MGLQPDSAPLMTTLSFASQQVVDLPHHSLIYPTFSKFHNKDFVGDGVKSLAEVKVHNIHCSPHIYPVSHEILEATRTVKHDFPLINPC